jgi:ABC-type cobalamin/Fe3+-siderophores transport system ATPase subunit
MLLAQGNVVVAGSAESVLTPENIEKHYGAKVTVLTHESGPVVIPERNK